MSGCQIAEPAVICQRTMSKELGQHRQGLVGEILVDEGLLPCQRFGGAARWLVIIFSVLGESLRIELSNGREAMLSLVIPAIVGLAENELAARSVVPEVEPVQHPRSRFAASRGFRDKPARRSCG